MSSNYVRNSYSEIVQQINSRGKRRLKVTVGPLSLTDKRDLDRLEKTIKRLQNIHAWNIRMYALRKQLRR